jgi:hypothetical protein
LVDSPPDKEYHKDCYLAIEAKSMTVSGQRPLYFSSHFSDHGRKHQIERMAEFLEKTGRRGQFAVELKEKPKREAFILPFSQIYDIWSDLNAGVPLNIIRSGKPLIWEGTFSKGQYKLS